VAPSERRIEISFCRVVARDSSRLATFAQTMSSTSTTTAPRMRTDRSSEVLTSYTPRAPESTSSRGTSVRCWNRELDRVVAGSVEKNESKPARAVC